MSLIQPLDLWSNFVLILAGSMDIFLILAVIMIVMLAARFRMNTWVLGLMMIVFGLVIAPYAQWFFIVMLLAGGVVLAFNLMRMLNPK